MDDENEQRKVTLFGIMLVAAVIFFVVEIVAAIATNFRIVPTAPFP